MRVTASANPPYDLGLAPHPEEGAQAPVSKDAAERGMKEMSDKFNAMGGQVYIDADKVKQSNKAL